MNKQLNRSCKSYIQNPTLLRTISRLRVPALFVYGDKDIRPSWPVEQVANLMPNAHLEFIEGAEHIIWFSHPNELESILRNFVDDTKRRELFSEGWSVDTTSPDSTVCRSKRG